MHLQSLALISHDISGFVFAVQACTSAQVRQSIAQQRRAVSQQPSGFASLVRSCEALDIETLQSHELRMDSCLARQAINLRCTEVDV